MRGSRGKIITLPRALAVIAPLGLTLAVAYNIERTPQTFVDTGTVTFTTPYFPRSPNSDSSVNASLISAGEVVVQSINSPKCLVQIANSGGTAKFTFSLVNFYNQDFPEYLYPFATLTVQSTSEVLTRRTFEAVLKVASQDLLQRQADAAAPKRSLMHLNVVGNTGPVVAAGSLKRVFATLGVLDLICLCILSRFFERYWPKRDLTFTRRLKPPSIRLHRETPRAMGRPY